MKLNKKKQVLKVWCLKSETCIQSLFLKFPHVFVEELQGYLIMN